ncbi:MAG TPA: GAF domain-containing protein, partial [Mycobacteriales bacterium]
MRMLMLMLMRLRVLWLAVLFAAVSLATRIIDVTAAPLHRRLLDLVGLASLTLAGVALLAAILEQRQGDRAAAESSAVRRLARLEQIMAIPFATESLDDLLPEMAVRLRQALESDFAAVLLVEDGALAVKVSSGADEAADVGTVVPPGAGLVGRVLQDGNTRAWGSLDPNRVALPSLAGGLESAAAAALVAGGAVIGVVAVGSKSRSRYDDARLAVLDFAAERLAGAVQRAQLRESERRASLGAE